MAAHDELRLAGVLEQGYGITPKAVMQDQRLTIEAKAIYAYIASFAGTGTTAFPGKKKIAADLKISEERLYTHRKLLIQYGYITVTQERGPGGTLGKTIYTLEAVAIERPCPGNPRTEQPRSEKPRTGNPSHNNNSSLKINSSLNKNREKITPSAIVEMYHRLCPSLPHVVKITDARKTTIKARQEDYTLQQIETAFKTAEASSFLKGKNDRGWKATFDWLMKPGNMAKVLEGNYSNSTTPAEPNRYSNIDKEETL